MAQGNERAKKSIKNAVVSTVYYLAILGLSFFSRRIFFDYLGSEVLGLNTTAKDLLSLLNITELGIGGAIAFLLYKPLHEKDHDKVREIVTVQGWLYRIVAYIIMAASCVLMGFFPLIFAKSPLPLSYAYLVFGTLLIGNMLGFFYNYRTIVLSAHQKQYKIVRINQGIEVLKIIVQIIAVSKFKNPFFWWLGLEFVVKVVCCYLLDRVIRKDYPWLDINLKNGKEYLARNKEIIKKTKQVIFHKLGGVALSNTSAPILYAYTSLTAVAFYANYQIVLGKISRLIGNFFSSTSAGVGDLVAEGNKSSIKRVFWELFDSRLLIASITILCCYHLTDPFISVWLSPDYLLGKNFLIIYLIMQGILMTRETVDSFISAHGMFQDIWSPIVEATINIGLSILFGHFWGLEGIILGVTSSLVIIIEIWKPFFLFKVGLKENPMQYFSRLAGRLAVILAVAFISTKICPLLPKSGSAGSSILDWTIYAVETTLLISLMLIPPFMAFSRGMRSFVKRMSAIILER